MTQRPLPESVDDLLKLKAELTAVADDPEGDTEERQNARLFLMEIDMGAMLAGLARIESQSARGFTAAAETVNSLISRSEALEAGLQALLDALDRPDVTNRVADAVSFSQIIDRLDVDDWTEDDAE